MATPLAGRSDTPITSSGEDRLGRNESAAAFARALLQLDVAEGAVVAVLGPWGAGKTSFVNLARPHLESAQWVVLSFNPWMFSGMGQLVDAFFTELVSQLRAQTKLRKVAEALSAYGEIFASLGALPVVGPWAKVVNAVGRHVRTEIDKREGVTKPRELVRRLLANLDRPIAVVIDDIDRLTTPDIRDIFKLVRLTGSFPNLVYVLAFDRGRVESALSEEGIPGRDYLEKIVFWSFDLPLIRPETLVNETLAGLEEALKDQEAGPFERERWVDVFAETVRPLIRNIRDVRRYVVAVRAAVAELGHGVALVDVLALEALRVFLPDTFRLLTNMIAELTSPSGAITGAVDPPSAKTAMEILIESAAPHGAVARSLIRRVFPAAERHLPQGSHYGAEWSSTWLRARRVAHPDLLRLYLERVAGDSLQAFSTAERIVGQLGDAANLAKEFADLDPAQRSAVITALETWEDEFAADVVVPASIGLLNLLPDVAEGGGGMFALRPDLVVGRVVLRLLRRLPDAVAVASAVRAIGEQVPMLSSRLLLVRLVGHVEHEGHKLVDASDAEALEREWRDQVRAADTRELLAEWDLLRLLYVVRKASHEGEPSLVIPESAALALAILRSSAGKARRQTMGNRAVKETVQLAWDALVEVFGTEDEVRERLEALNELATEEDGRLVALGKKYLSGWRPKDFDPLDEEEESA